MQREPPVVTMLARQPGTKESRYAHLLCGEVEDAVVARAPSPAEELQRPVSWETRCRAGKRNRRSPPADGGYATAVRQFPQTIRMSRSIVLFPPQCVPHHTASSWPIRQQTHSNSENLSRGTPSCSLTLWLDEPAQEINYVAVHATQLARKFWQQTGTKNRFGKRRRIKIPTTRLASRKSSIRRPEAGFQRIAGPGRGALATLTSGHQWLFKEHKRPFAPSSDAQGFSPGSGTATWRIHRSWPRQRRQSL